jgi:RNA polymerase sigma factor (sigma-70 family)
MLAYALPISARRKERCAMSAGESQDRGWYRGAHRRHFSEVYRSEKPRLIRYFFRELGNKADADEMAQETLARFLRSAPPGITTPRGYLTRIAHNLVKDRSVRNSTRMAQRSVPLDDGMGAASPFDPHRDLEARENVTRWRAILQRLPVDTLEVFMLNRVEGFSFREIADKLEIPLWKVQKHMLRAVRHVGANRSDSDD